MKSTFKRIASILALFAISVSAHPLALGSTDTNTLVLRAIQTMPTGGGYKTTDEAADAFIKAVQSRPTLKVDASGAKPSFCTTATYLVFLKVLEALQKKTYIKPQRLFTMHFFLQPTSTLFLKMMAKTPGAGGTQTAQERPNFFTILRLAKILKTQPFEERAIL